MADLTLAGTFKLAIESLNMLKNMVVAVEVKAKVSELYDIILAGQTSALESTLKQQTMLETIAELKEKLARVEAWETTKQRYKLHQFRSGHFAYMLKKESQGDEPFHYLCAACYNNGKTAILDVVPFRHMPGTSYRCTVSSAHGFNEE